MINELTKEQWDKVPLYLDKWLKIGHDTSRINREKAKKAIEWAYEFAGFEKPEIFIYLDSPMAIQIAANLIKNIKWDKDIKLDSKLDSKLVSKLDSQIDPKLRSQIASRLCSQLYSQLASELASQLASQINSQLASKLISKLHSLINSLASQLRSQLHSQLYSQLESQLASQLYSQLERFNDVSYKWYCFCIRQSKKNS